jgi:hypothetical protein
MRRQPYLDGVLVSRQLLVIPFRQGCTQPLHPRHACCACNGHALAVGALKQGLLCCCTSSKRLLYQLQVSTYCKRPSTWHSSASRPQRASLFIVSCIHHCIA